MDPEDHQVYESANSRGTVSDFALARIKFMGDLTAEGIGVGDEDVEPVLGWRL